MEGKMVRRELSHPVLVRPVKGNFFSFICCTVIRCDSEIRVLRTTLIYRFFGATDLGATCFPVLLIIVESDS